jgi:hypothetical protein
MRSRRGAVPVVVTLLGSHVDYTSKARMQGLLLDTLTLAKRLPESIVGSGQIARDIDRQTLHLAYVTQYPRRAREIRDIGLIGIGVIAAVVVYYLLLWVTPPCCICWPSLLSSYSVRCGSSGPWSTSAATTQLRRSCSGTSGHPRFWCGPHTDLILKAPALTIETVFERAADVRDGHGAPLSTLDAVNLVLAQAHTHGAWRRELRQLAHRARNNDYRAHLARSYDWLLRHLLGPFFKWRSAFLDGRERHRLTGGELWRVPQDRLAHCSLPQRTTSLGSPLVPAVCGAQGPSINRGPAKPMTSDSR